MDMTMDKLDHQNTHQKQPREVMEQVQAELTKLLSAVSENSRKFAAAALTIMTLSWTAHAEDATNKIALNSTPSASVPTAEKGGWQIVTLKNGKTMSFYEISRLSWAEKDDILDNQIKASQRERFDEWELMAANQRIEEKKWVEQAANQEEKKIDTNIQAANQEKNNYTEKKEAAIKEILIKAPTLLKKYESDIKNGSKLNQKDKELLEYIKNIGKPEDIIIRIEKLLKNPRNFA